VLKAKEEISVERIAPIDVAAIASVAGDALGNFHIAISLCLATLALGAFLAARRTLGFAATYLAIALAASAAVANVLEPHEAHGVATMVNYSRAKIEGHLYRETEHEAYGYWQYVTVEQAAGQSGTMLPSGGMSAQWIFQLDS